MASTISLLTSTTILCCLILCIVAPPPRRGEESTTAPPDHGKPGTDKDLLNLPYERYLMEVVKALEKDESFQKKLSSMTEEEVKSGKIAEHLDELHVDIRSRLTDLKVREIERLRDMISKQIELEGHENINIDKQIGHIDAGDISTFNKEDLRKLIKKTVSDLDELDRKRREEFKEYEMKKEAIRQHNMSKLSEAEIKKANEEHEKMQQRHKQHPDLNHPGGKEQLEEVWEEKDKMAGNDFDPRTFFALHDIDGNGYWDQGEIEALFQLELDKMYNDTKDDDPREREEEMNRMREHVMKEIDKDGNLMISLEEFMAETKTKDFKEDTEWETLDQQKIYTDEELKKFEEQLAREMNWGKDAYPTPPGQMPVQQQQYQQQYQQQQVNPQQGQQVPQYQQVPQQVNQQPQQQQQQFQQGQQQINPNQGQVPLQQFQNQQGQQPQQVNPQGQQINPQAQQGQQVNAQQQQQQQQQVPLKPDSTYGV